MSGNYSTSQTNCKEMKISLIKSFKIISKGIHLVTEIDFGVLNGKTYFFNKKTKRGSSYYYSYYS